MRGQLRLPGFQKKQPGGGEVETGRGKKAKKAGWHVTLGAKDAHLRRDRLGGFADDEFRPGSPGRTGRYLPGGLLLGFVGPRWGQGGPVDAGARTPWGGSRGDAGNRDLDYSGSRGGASSGCGPAPPTPGAAAPARPGPVTGSIAPLPSPAATKKKGKTGTTHHDQKSREEEMRQVRQEVVQKLKFQNSFDTGPKARQPKAKDHDKAQPTQVRVAEYRTSKEAQARVAELHKKGVKATLKTTKDSKGTLYIVYKTTSPVQPAAEKIVQKPEKSSGANRKPQAE